jgi:YidC/Oxa1 family membrane protein insertase
MEERRLLIAVALSLLVLTAYQMWFAPPPKPAARPAVTTLAAVPRAAPSAPVLPGTPSASPVAVAAVADAQERRVELRGRDVELAFSNRGARLLSWRLTQFKDAHGHGEEMVQATREGPRPLDFETGDEALDARLREALFVPSAESAEATSGPAHIAFEFSDGAVHAQKRVEVHPQGYVATVSVSVTRDGRPVSTRLIWGPGVANPTTAEMDVRGYEDPAGVALAAGSVERIPPSKATAPRALPDVAWVGVEGHYFAALLVPARGAAAGEVRASSLAPAEDGRARVAALAALDLGTSSDPVSVYVGPKDHHVLAPLGHEMARVVPVGDWIGPIVVGLAALLRWVQHHVGNYGWSIVALTVLINLAMSPLRHYSIANGVKMARLAPEMRVIQDRYRKVPALDPKRQEMQKEISALYARHGMSMGTQMAVGCVPLLITMPFLIAFYRVLQVSIDLRGAPFLWIHDLSQRDPLFITPVLMGLSMFLMQKMMPTAMDPAQQRVMMIMPLVLVVMFFAAPAGLNLYWLASNLCSVLQQAITLQLVKEHLPRKAAR